MSNPTSVVTERRLGEFYQEILPYLGGSADAGFTPVGSVIAIMGVTAPANYLACNGQIVNVADYPELANYFEQQFGTKYKFGGSGTTFGIPDLRGQFLRGTGTNSDSTQGSGSAVGVRQKATEHGTFYSSSNSYVYFPSSDNGYSNYKREDRLVDRPTTAKWTGTGTRATQDSVQAYTSRPTNTSILWCIATKDIYLNPSMDYSTSEKVVGKWIDGKTIYQKTVQTTSPAPSSDGTLTEKYTDLGVSIDSVINVSSTRNSNHAWGNLPLTNPLNASSVNYTMMAFVYDNSASNNANKLRLTNNCSAWANIPVYVTIQYTKTT